MMPRMPPPPLSQPNNPNHQQPPPLMSLNPFNENARENPSKTIPTDPFNDDHYLLSKIFDHHQICLIMDHQH